MNVRLLATAGALAGILAGSQVSAQPVPVNVPGARMHLRGDRSSDRNLLQVRRRLEALIDQLQRDQHDYAGHRVKAIDDLQMARNEIEAALRADTSDRGR
ncbi:MAG: hypothetical protein JOZ24_00625 [Candidatus Eremiobacteraeota bacterium]|nr:hypothetical protein [Candidatus Eremiobacteraeota bacterium]